MPAPSEGVKVLQDCPNMLSSSHAPTTGLVTALSCPGKGAAVVYRGREELGLSSPDCMGLREG